MSPVRLLDLAGPAFEPPTAPTERERGVVEFVVHGKAEPGGSKKAYVNPKTQRAIVTDANAKVGPWKDEVRRRAADAMAGRQLLDGPIQVTFVFYRVRLASHFGTGRNAGILKPSAPSHPTTRPDVLKLARAVEDALTGIVYRDDSQIVTEMLVKEYGEPARVLIRVQRLT